jgi:hypothetical protein
LTFIGSVDGAARNLATGVAAVIADTMTTASFVLDVPDAIEVHVSLDELFGIWRATRARLPVDTPAGDIIVGLPAELVDILSALNRQWEADDLLRTRSELPDHPDVRFLPRRVAGRLGLGDAVLINVQVDQQSGRLHSKAIAELERVVPGMTRPGSNTYMPGVRQAIATLTSPSGLRGTATRFFRARDKPGEDSETTLATLPFVTTHNGGATLVLLVLNARPGATFATTANAVRLFGRASDAHGLEAHEASGGGKVRTNERRREIRGSLAAAAMTPGESVGIQSGATRGELAVLRDWRRAVTLGGFDKARTISKPWVAFDVRIPLEFNIEAHRIPLPGAPRAALLPHIADGALSLWTAVAGARPSPDAEWFSAVATVRVAEGDGSPLPLRVEPPEWYHPPTVLGNDPREDHIIDIGGVPPGFHSNQVREWQPFRGMPDGYKVSWFDGSKELATLGMEVLPAIAANALTAVDIQEFLDGLAATPFVHELLRPEGIEHTFDVWDSVPLVRHQGRLKIAPVLATEWLPATDRMAGSPQPFRVGRLSSSTVEWSPVRSTTAAVAATVGQHVAVTGNAGPNVWIRRAVVNPAMRAAPGNRRLAAVSPQVASVRGGRVVRTLVTSASSQRRGLRMLPRPGGSSPTSPSSNVLAFRHILFRVTGTSSWRLSAAGEPRGETTQVRWLVATVEARVHQSALPSAARPEASTQDDLDGAQTGGQAFTRPAPPVNGAGAPGLEQEAAPATTGLADESDRALVDLTSDGLGEPARAYLAAVESRRREVLTAMLATAGTGNLEAISLLVRAKVASQPDRVDAEMVKAMRLATVGQVEQAMSAADSVREWIDPAGRVAWILLLDRAGTRWPTHAAAFKNVARAAIVCPEPVAATSRSR